MTASVPRKPVPATIPVDQIPAIDVTGAKDGKHQVCGVDLKPDAPKEIRQLLKPKVDINGHPFFKDRGELTDSDKRKGKRAQKRGEEHFMAGQQLLQQANQALQSGDSDTAKKFQKQATEKMGKAFTELKDAFFLVQDPQDKTLLQELAFVSTQVGYTALAKELYRIHLNDLPCDLQTRQARIVANQAMLMALNSSKGQIPADRQQEAAKIGVQSQIEIELDQGLLINRTTKDISEAIGKILSGYADKDSAGQAAALKEAFPMVMQMVQLVGATPDTKLYQDTFATTPEIEGRKILTTIMKFTGESSDPEVQKYHRAMNLVYHKNFGNSAYAFSLTETIVQEGFKELGAGDVAKGKEKVEAMLKKVQEAKTQEEAQSAMKDLLGLPPGFVEAYAIREQIDGMVKVRKEGLVAIGSGDAAKGKEKVETFLKEVNPLQDDLQRLDGQVKKLQREGKKDEAEKLTETLKTKQEKGTSLVKEFAKQFPSEQEFGAFMEAYQAISGMEDLQKKEKVTRTMTVLKTYADGIFNAENDSQMEPTYSNAAWWLVKGVYAGPRAFITGKTAVDDFQEIRATDLDIFAHMEKKLRTSEAENLMEAAEQTQRDGEEPIQERLEVLLSGETGLDIKLLLEYSSTPTSDPIKAKALLAEAQKLKEKDVQYVKTAWALERLVAETCTDPEVVQLAQAQMNTKAKAA